VGVVAALLLMIYPDDAGVPMIGGAVFGVLAGAFQARALWSSPAAFAATVSAADVRRQLMSSLAGKLSVACIWGGAAMIAWLAWNLSRAHLLGTFAAGYVTLMLFRELLTLYALGRVKHAGGALLPPPRVHS
jgi:hypothetical protein